MSPVCSLRQVLCAQTSTLDLSGPGAERAGEQAGGAAALLSPAAEEALRAAVYEGAAFSSHKAGPAEVLMGQLQQPFMDLRVAAYRYLPLTLAHVA